MKSTRIADAWIFSYAMGIAHAFFALVNSGEKISFIKNICKKEIVIHQMLG